MRRGRWVASRVVSLVRPWFDAAIGNLPENTRLWDAHTHTGQKDPDGVTGTAERLIEKLRGAAHSGAVVSTNQDPNGYGEANDRILTEAENSEGALIPFLRVDPNEGAAATVEVARSLDRGHRGIKLHPRAENFTLNAPSLDAILRVASERAVPVLVHAGRGIPSLGRDAVDRCLSDPDLRLILAHAAISDLAWLGREANNIPGLYFDTSWWDITDLMALLAWAPPGRILHASDTPYGHPELACVLTIRAAVACGYDDSLLAAIVGQNLQRLLRGEDALQLQSPSSPKRLGASLGLLRLHSHLNRAVVRAFARLDVVEAVALARLACDLPASDSDATICAAIATTLGAIDPTATRGIVRPLIALAAAALTPEAPVPV